MKRVLSLAVFSALLLGGAYAIYHTARGKVVAKKATDALDEMIGPTEVKREVFAQRIKKLDEAIDKLAEERIRTEEEAKTQQKHIKEQETGIKDAETALEKVQKGLTTVSEGKPVEVSGKEYTALELEAIGKRIVAKHKEQKNKLDAMKETLNRQQARAAKFKQQEDDLSTEVATLKLSLKEIDDKIKEVDSLKRAAAAAGDADRTVGENLEELKKSVSELNANLEVRLRKENRNWEKVGKTGDDADKFIQATKGTSQDTLSEIDAILKNRK